MVNLCNWIFDSGGGSAVDARTGRGGGDGKALWGPNCLNCHNYDPKTKLIMGDFQSYSRLANLLTVKIGPKPQMVKVTDQTKLENAAAYRDLTGDNA